MQLVVRQQGRRFCCCEASFHRGCKFPTCSTQGLPNGQSSAAYWTVEDYAIHHTYLRQVVQMQIDRLQEANGGCKCWSFTSTTCSFVACPKMQTRSRIVCSSSLLLKCRPVFLYFMEMHLSQWHQLIKMCEMKPLAPVPILQRVHVVKKISGCDAFAEAVCCVPFPGPHIRWQASAA